MRPLPGAHRRGEGSSARVPRPLEELREAGQRCPLLRTRCSEEAVTGRVCDVAWTGPAFLRGWPCCAQGAPGVRTEPRWVKWCQAAWALVPAPL